MLYQRTVKTRICGSGVGLHSGRETTFTILPAAPDSGLVFVRTDLTPHVEIPARSEHVVCTRLATTLGHKGVTIGTVEHLVAALYGLGIDNARIEIDGPEVPILDGSSARFVRLLTEAGTIAQLRPKRFLVVERPVQVKSEDGTAIARLEPARSFQVRCTIDFNHPIVSHQSFEMPVTDKTFVKELAKARTFGFAKDVDRMHREGLARGGSLENAVVVDDFSIRNPEGLRFPDEFVRHKALDAVGDLALLGAPVLGRYVGHKSGHTLNTQLAAELLAKPQAYSYREFRERRELERAHRELPALGGLAPA